MNKVLHFDDEHVEMEQTLKWRGCKGLRTANQEQARHHNSTLDPHLCAVLHTAECGGGAGSLRGAAKRRRVDVMAHMWHTQYRR